MNPLKSFRQWLTNRSKRRHYKRRRLLDNMSCESINITEFNGAVYIAFNGKPIVRTNRLNTSVIDVLAQSRQDYLAWKEQFED